MRHASSTSKPHLRAIALRCVKGSGPFVFGDRYLAVKGHMVPSQTWFDIMIEPNVMRTVHESSFVPENPDNWRLFSLPHRLRYAPHTFGPNRNDVGNSAGKAAA